MKLVRFNGNRIGLLVGNAIRDVTVFFDLDARWPLPPGDIMVRQLWDLMPTLATLDRNAPLVPLDEVRLDAPVANPNKIIGAPVNYRSGAEAESGYTAVEDSPLAPKGLFVKANSSLAGPSTAMRLTFPDRPTNHEVELAVVIGREVRDIRAEDALGVVAGYTIGLDMSLGGPEQPSYRKSPDGYAIIGPWLVTPDEIADPDNLALSLSVGGVLRQSASTRLLILNVAQLIAYASRVYTLYPGDILMTGTPGGIGSVGDGDTISASVEGLGALEIRVTI